jgi:hypothetical protein
MPRQLYDYNEVNIRECRICLDSNISEKGELISPCACAGSQKYIHRDCLNRWRNGNRDRESYTNCEICKSPYIIEQGFPLETWKIRTYNHSLLPTIIYYCLYLYTTSFFFWEIDYRLDYISITLACLEDKQSFICRKIPSNDTAPAVIYYMSFSSIFTSCIFFLFMISKSFFSIHRKCVYWKKMFPQLALHIGASANMLFIYFLYSIFPDITIFLLFLLFVTSHNIIFNLNYCKEHNKTICIMNTIENQDRVLSIEDNTERTNDIV